MRTIGIRELKSRLSQVLREVQQGDAVLVTDRGRVVAELRLPDASAWGRSAPGPEAALARLAASGHLRLAEPAPDPYPASPIRSPAGLARRLLYEERGEG
jgi:antitoxin (DNA-binding transcriptional repressor) of toxin-antitoxin stability system